MSIEMYIYPGNFKSLTFIAFIVISLFSACKKEIPNGPSTTPPLGNPNSNNPGSIAVYTQFDFRDGCSEISVSVDNFYNEVLSGYFTSPPGCNSSGVAKISGLPSGKYYNVKAYCGSITWAYNSVYVSPGGCTIKKIQYEDAFPGQAVFSIFLADYKYTNDPKLLVWIDDVPVKYITEIASEFVCGDRRSATAVLSTGSHKLRVNDQYQPIQWGDTILNLSSGCTYLTLTTK